MKKAALDENHFDEIFLLKNRQSSLNIFLQTRNLDKNPEFKRKKP